MAALLGVLALCLGLVGVHGQVIPNCKYTLQSIRGGLRVEYCFTVESAATFSAATQQCVSRQGTLALPKAGDIHTTIQGLLAAEKMQEVWIGGQQVVGAWAFVNGQSLGPFTNWATNEPQGAGNCAALTPSDWKWRALQCSFSLHYVCERVTTTCTTSTVFQKDFSLGGKCYSLHYQGTTWLQAGVNCRQLSGSLISLAALSDQTIMAEVSRQINANNIRSNGYWFGLSRTSWTWVDTEMVTNSFWEASNPTSGGGECMAMRSFIPNSTPEFLWVNDNCAGSKMAICQIVNQVLGTTAAGSGTTAPSIFTTPRVAALTPTTARQTPAARPGTTFIALTPTAAVRIVTTPTTTTQKFTTPSTPRVENTTMADNITTEVTTVAPTTSMTTAAQTTAAPTTAAPTTVAPTTVAPTTAAATTVAPATTAASTTAAPSTSAAATTAPTVATTSAQPAAAEAQSTGTTKLTTPTTRLTTPTVFTTPTTTTPGPITTPTTTTQVPQTTAAATTVAVTSSLATSAAATSVAATSSLATSAAATSVAAAAVAATSVASTSVAATTANGTTAVDTTVPATSAQTPTNATTTNPFTTKSSTLFTTPRQFTTPTTVLTTPTTPAPRACSCQRIRVSGPEKVHAASLGFYTLQTCEFASRAVYKHDLRDIYLYYTNDSTWAFGLAIDQGPIFIRNNDSAELPANATSTWEVLKELNGTEYEAEPTLKVDCACGGIQCDLAEIVSSQYSTTIPGRFVKRGQLNGRPYYENTDHGVFLYLKKSSTCTYWAVGPTNDGNSPFMVANDIALTPEEIKATWNVHFKTPTKDEWSRNNDISIRCLAKGT